MTEQQAYDLNRANNHRVLMQHTKDLPCKVIEIDNKPYIQRYFIGEDKNGNHQILHRFLTADTERFLHNHPWSAVSEILTGGYREEVLHSTVPVDLAEILTSDKVKSVTETRWLMEGDQSIISPDTIHRIIEVIPDTWTALTIAPERLDQWFFIDESGNKTPMATTPKDWWKSAKTRDGGEPDATQLALN